jgi:K+-transporting ATPase ATPase C chain
MALEIWLPGLFLLGLVAMAGCFLFMAACDVWWQSGLRIIRTHLTKAPDLAIPFFENFSAEHPGMFPSAVTENGADSKPQTSIQPVKDGSDIQSNFFDMWRQEHADADLQDVPGNLVTASGSGLDPHITLANAEFQLDRVAAKWSDDTQHDAGEVRKEIDQLLQNNSSAPFGGLAGEKLVNVLEVNLELCKRYRLPK